MHPAAFDTLKLFRILESAGMPAKQAQAVSAALSESLAEWLSANIERDQNFPKAGFVNGFLAGMNFTISATDKLVSGSSAAR
jgi:hypothetical protein